MSNNKVDRRVKYTKMVLKESFINLLEQKDISQISIKKICEDADINRATFYAHYNDIFDLMRKIEDEFLENINAHLEEYYEINNSERAIILAEKIFEYVKENARLCKLLLSERGNFDFQKRVMMLVYDLIISELTYDNRISKTDAEYVYSFTITGCVGAVQKWLEEDMKQSPRYMAEMIVNLILGLMNLVKTKK